MKSIVASLLVLAVAAHAQPLIGMDPDFGVVNPTVMAPVPGAPVFSYAPITTQYHSQDELGQASFGYSFPGQAAANYRDRYGNQIGSWSFYDADGNLVRVSYTSDFRGFRVLSNNLPIAPLDTPEVAQAKAAHFAAWNAARLAAVAAAASAPVVVSDPAPIPISRKKRQALGLPLPYAGSSIGSPAGAPFGVYGALGPYGSPYGAFGARGPYATPYGALGAPFRFGAPYSALGAPFSYAAPWAPMMASTPFSVLPPQMAYNSPVSALSGPLSAPVAVDVAPVEVSPV